MTFFFKFKKEETIDSNIQWIATMQRQKEYDRERVKSLAATTNNYTIFQSYRFKFLLLDILKFRYTFEYYCYGKHYFPLASSYFYVCINIKNSQRSEEKHTHCDWDREGRA